MIPNKLISDLKLEGLLENLEKIDWESRIEITLQAIKDVLPFSVTTEKKNNAESIKLRKEADQLIVNNKGRNVVLLDAREKYSKSIAYAENCSAALAQGYANRSCALFHLYKFKECIRDIERALKCNYPDHLRPNLLKRKAKCLKMLGDKNVEDVCEEARCLLENVNLSDEKKEKLEKNINDVNKILEISVVKETCNILPNFVPHPYIPSASEAIDLKYNEDIGRHYVAKRNINTGEILILEKAYVTFLGTPNNYTHCSNCLNRAWDIIPCENCVYDMYCSQKCKDEAWRQYHDIECSIKRYISALKLNHIISGLKLTLLALKESGSIKSLQRELNEIDDCKDYFIKLCSKDGLLHSDRYRPLYTLMTHENNRHQNDILAISLNSAIVLFYINKYTNLFNELDKSIPSLCNNKDALFFGKFFAQNFMKIQLNEHEYSELFGESMQFQSLGTIAAPVISFFNHSCNPNVTKCPLFKDGAAHLMYFALHPISKGSQLLDDYGCNFICTPKSNRKEFLHYYYFKCNCEACDNLWPTLDSLQSVFTYVTDTDKRIKLARILIHSAKWERSIWDTGCHVCSEHAINIMKDLIRSITEIYKTTKEPSKEFYQLIDSFRSVFIKYYAPKYEL